MTISTHTAIGAVLGGFVGGPIIGFFAGMLSHFLVDMIPHGDAKLGKEFHTKRASKSGKAYVTIDGVSAIFILLIFFNLVDFDSRFVFSCTIAGSVLPDILAGIHGITKTKYLRWFVKLHFFFHDFFTSRYGDVRLRWAIMGQAVFILLLVRWM